MSWWKFAIRSVFNAIFNRFAVAYAWFTYALYGIEGVNRILRLAPKPRVIPILRAIGAQIGTNCDIESPLILHNAMNRYRNLIIGGLCHIGKEVFIDLADHVTLEEQVTISMRVMILTHTDVGHSPLRNSALPVEHQPVILEAGAYIGAGAILLPGVRIGSWAVVGAGAVVTKSVDSGTLVVGVPARVLRSVKPAGGAANIQPFNPSLIGGK
jgi:acetyltransferase-like isoleucine patch superfamily enzyme